MARLMATAGTWEPQRAAIRSALRLAGLNQVQIAERLGVTQKHVSCVLTGKTAGSLDLWVALAGLVGMSWQLAPATGADAAVRWIRNELGLTVESWQADRLRAYFQEEQ